MRDLLSLLPIPSAVLAFFFMLSLPALAQQAPQFDREPLIVETADGHRFNFTVEIAATPDQRAYGLMFREKMAQDAGMLFDFGVTRRVTMWMENTILPLDMLFADARGTITHIKQDATPYSRDIIDSMGDVRYVVELNAGTVSRLGIRPGDRIASATTTRKVK
jgi:uncharacterized membrane protein (UPF0127 family)